MKSKMVFEDFRAWYLFLWSAVKQLCMGFARIVFAVVFGLWSLVVHAWRYSVRWVGRYPQVALGAFLVIVFILWLLMFARNRAVENGLTAQRDMVEWEYKNFKESHGYE